MKTRKILFFAEFKLTFTSKEVEIMWSIYWVFYSMNDRGIVVRLPGGAGNYFSYPLNSDRLWGSVVQYVLANFSLEVKRPEYEAYHSPLCTNKDWRKQLWPLREWRSPLCPCLVCIESEQVLSKPSIWLLDVVFGEIYVKWRITYYNYE